MSKLAASHYAYNQLPEVEAVMRLQAVKRWHMIETSRTQTLAEHSANVALLAWVIARTSPGAFFNSGQVVISALVHDLGESFIGDIPTPTKRLLGREKVNALELQALPSIFSQGMEISTAENDLIKICDLVDGIRFIRLNGVDQTGRWAKEGLEEQLAAKFDKVGKEWPAEVFMHVSEKVIFYAYEETRIEPKGIHSEFVERVMDSYLARRRDGEPGGT